MHSSIAKIITIAFFFAGSIGTACATTDYQWTLSGGGVSGSGLLTTGAADNGGYDVLSFTGSIDGNALMLYGGQPGPNGASTPGGGVYFDNILYPALNSGSPNCAGGATLVDGCGIAFSILDGYGNIFDNYSGKGTGAYQYFFVDDNENVGDDDATFTITPYTATPEPGSVILLATGLIAFGIACLKRPRMLPAKEPFLS